MKRAGPIYDMNSISCLSGVGRGGLGDTNVIAPKLHLIPILCRPRRTRHQARVVDEDIQTVVVLQEVLRRFFHSLQRSEIHRQEFELSFTRRHFFLDLGDGCISTLLRSCCEDDVLGIVFGELEDGFFA